MLDFAVSFHERELTVDVTLTFISLCDEKIRNVPADVVLIARRVAAEDLLKSARLLA